ncbi:LysR substrate-binding domain-containing protein [Paludibacterium denitrificans]|uniref:LysR substrate-binding domain-containing protein n=1 Tax=Paludibacterium denitrificans TaxID=2675226 RepID=UPI001FD87DD9|nr:LysR substrate-binding domain-containing protein [Paludibacterium denitrificans]
MPRVVTAFKQAYPRVHLVLHQASPDELVRLLLDGEADIGIATEAVADVPDLVSFPYYSWHHTVIAPNDHPLQQVQPLTLEALSDYPLVTYHQGFTGRAQIDRSFAEAGLSPDIVMAALDADVIKTYVELGMGIGIVANMAVDPARDQGITELPGPALFGSQTTRLAIRRGHYLRSYAYRFIELCSSALDEDTVRRALSPAPVHD